MAISSGPWKQLYPGQVISVSLGHGQYSSCSLLILGSGFPQKPAPHGIEAIPASCCPYLAGSSGGQAGGQASWLCSRLVMMAWRKSSTVALGSAGG